jgi:hypothetical protein
LTSLHFDVLAVVGSLLLLTTRYPAVAVANLLAVVLKKLFCKRTIDYRNQKKTIDANSANTVALAKEADFLSRFVEQTGHIYQMHLLLHMPIHEIFSQVNNFFHFFSPLAIH